MKKLCFMFLLTMFSASIHAQLLSTTGVVAGYIASENNGKELFVFQTEGAPAQGCNVTARFAVNSDSPLHKGTQVAVMAAFHSKTPVTVFYSNSCQALDNAADLRWTCVGNLPC